MQMHADTSRKGASFLAKQADTNLRAVILDLLAENPRGSAADVAAHKRLLFPLYQAILRADLDYQRASDWYSFVNFYEYSATNRNTKHSAEDRSNYVDTKSKRITALKGKILEKIVLLELVLPNGKALRDCTFADCAKAGGWFSKLAKQGKPKQVVGKVLTEEQLRALK